MPNRNQTQTSDIESVCVDPNGKEEACSEKFMSLYRNFLKCDGNVPKRLATDLDQT